MSFRAQPRNLLNYKSVISTERSERRNLPGTASDTFFTAPRSVRSSASTLRKTGSKSLKRRTCDRGGGQGRICFHGVQEIFTLFSCKTVVFARKRSRRRKKQTRQIYMPCCKTSLAATRRGVQARERSDGGGEARSIYCLAATRYAPFGARYGRIICGLDMRRPNRRVVAGDIKNAPSVGNKLPPAPHGDGEP